MEHVSIMYTTSMLESAPGGRGVDAQTWEGPHKQREILEGRARWVMKVRLWKGESYAFEGGRPSRESQKLCVGVHRYREVHP